MAKTRPEDEFLKFYYNRWRRSETVSLMSITARGVYWELLLWQFDSDKGSVPCDPELCRQLIRAEPEEWAKFAPYFEEAFPIVGGRRVNSTMASARAERDAAKARGKGNGDRGGRPEEPKPPKDVTETKPKENQQVNQNETYRLTEEEVEEELEGKGNPPTPQGAQMDHAPVVGYLNERAGKSYDPGSKTCGHLRALFKSTPKAGRDDLIRTCRLVVDHRVSLWAKDPRMRGYLRPETLFAPGHWDTYRQEAAEWESSGRSSPAAIVGRTQKHESVEQIYARL